MNDDSHAEIIDGDNCISLYSDLVHMVEVLKIAYVTSWKSMRRSGIRKGKQVGGCKSTAIGWSYLQ